MMVHKCRLARSNARCTLFMYISVQVITIPACRFALAQRNCRQFTSHVCIFEILCMLVSMMSERILKSTEVHKIRCEALAWLYMHSVYTFSVTANKTHLQGSQKSMLQLVALTPARVWEVIILAPLAIHCTSTPKFDRPFSKNKRAKHSPIQLFHRTWFYTRR